MQKIKCLVLKIGILGLRFVYAFIKVFPIKNKVTFISRQSNNMTLDFIEIEKELKSQFPEIKTVILMKKMDKKFSYFFHFFRQMFHIATSKVVILDSYCIVISILNHKKKLKVIQIWHALGSMKKFGYAMIGKKEGSTKEIAEIMKMHKNYDYILISSFNFIKDFLEGFNTSKDIIKEIPLPRVDLLLNENYKSEQAKRLYKKNPKLKNKKNILYCSTFRKEQQEGCKNIENLIDLIDFKEYNFLYKPHPLNNVKINNKKVIQDFESTFEALFVADYVICDYSSIIYEVGLLKIPLFLYGYDWNEYKNKRELNIDIEKDTGLLFTDDAKKIIDAIKNNEYDGVKFEKFVAKNINTNIKNCTREIVELIKKNL